MFCKQCGHENGDNKFCVRCGTALTGDPASSAIQAGQSETAASAAAGRYTAASNDTLQRTKQISKQYFTYFGQVIRFPYQIAQNVRGEQFVNGIISIVLLSLLFPLIVYIGFSKTGYGHPPFGSFVIEPLFYFLIIFALITAVIFAVLRLGGVAIDYKGVAARFGTLLIPAVLCAALSCVFVLLDMSYDVLSFFMMLGLIFLFISISATILSFKKERIGGLDTLYGLVIANVASGYIFYKVISFASGSFDMYFRDFGSGFPTF